MTIKVFFLSLLLFLLSGCSADPHTAEPAPSTEPAVSVIETQPEVPEAPTLSVHLMNVGQAECILITCDGQNLLIDSGTKDMSSRILRYLEYMGIEDLDYVISTHVHSDHVGSFPAIFDRYPVGTVYAMKEEYSSSVYKAFLKSVKKHGLTITHPELGEQFSLGPAVVTFLGPVQSYEKINDNSIVVSLRYGTRTFLLTGDMEAEAEYDMMDYWGDRVNWNADVLKVGHHCVDTSTSERFAKAVCPELAIASCSTKYPPFETPKKTLLQLGATLYHTETMGPIVVTTDGTDLDIVWNNHEALPDYGTPTAKLDYYGDPATNLFHMDRCAVLPSISGCDQFVSLRAALTCGYEPCSLCLGSACG